MKLKKLRKIYRIIFPKQLSASAIFESRLGHDKLVSGFEKKGLLYEVMLHSGFKVVMRNQDFSDYMVLQQIFGVLEYDTVLSILQMNTVAEKKKIIIDAGANVGYTSVFLSTQLPDSMLIAIEPDHENAKMFRQNIAFLDNPGDIQLYQNALSHQKGLTFNLERDFRDGLDWSVSTSEHATGKIAGITLAEIIEAHDLQYISLLKIDIEGAERFIFGSESDVSFLQVTEVIAIEIHDEFKIEAAIHTILKENKFLLMRSGEMTVGINMALLEANKLWNK